MAQLQSVFNAIVLSHVLYSAPAWRGYLSAGEMTSLHQLPSKHATSFRRRPNVIYVGITEAC